MSPFDRLRKAGFRGSWGGPVVQNQGGQRLQLALGNLQPAFLLLRLALSQIILHASVSSSIEREAAVALGASVRVTLPQKRLCGHSVILNNVQHGAPSSVLDAVEGS